MRLYGSSRRLLLRGVVACAVVLTPACDFLDPTNVTNPNTTLRDLAGAAEPTAALLPGLRAQMARTVGSVVQVSDIVSDNFEIAFTNITGELGDPWLVDPDGGSYNSTGGLGAYWNTQELRALADFIIDSIAPGDETATDAQLAEALYFRGMAFLMQGENFSGLPTGPDQEPISWQALLELAEGDFNQALSLDPADELAVSLQAALARTYRGLGRADDAERLALQALARDADFVVLQNYSAGEIENPIFGNDRSFEPLPRLDFLDPKYVDRDAGIPVGKAEEMHLILAEVAMSRGDYAGGVAQVAAAVAMAAGRPVGATDDLDDRLNADLTIRPRDAEVLVRADPDSPFRAGLVLTRPGVVEVPTISGTSLGADSVAALTDPLEIRHAFWLARQEIFFLEGRRVHDLGVRLPISAREIDASPAIEHGDPETVVQVPAYIPQGVIDRFSPRSPYVNPTEGGELTTDQITIDIDMNKVLAGEQVSAFGPLP